LKSEQHTDNSRQEENRSDQVQLLDLFLEGVLVQNCLWTLEEEKDEKESHASNRQVDIEAPAPGEVVSECTSHTSAC